MGHNINVVDGKAAFASAKEKAWHGLGQVVEEAMTSEEAINLAGLNYEVGIAPVLAQVVQEIRVAHTGVVKQEGQQVIVPDKYATYRKDTNQVFGIVGSKYHVVQNSKAFEFVDDIIGSKEAVFETAGALGDGETIFVTAKLPTYIKVGQDDVENYLLFTNSHDGSSAVQVMFTPIRVVCNNTLTWALREAKNKVGIRHTKSVDDRLKLAQDILGISHIVNNELNDIFNGMNKTRIDDNQIIPTLDKIFFDSQELKNVYTHGVDRKEIISTRKFNTIEAINEYYHSGVGQQKIAGTVWGLYNAVTGYGQNVKNFSSDEQKMKALLPDGSFGKIAMKSFQVSKALVELN